MSDMTPIERFSGGEISRIELGRLLGEPISFGDTLMMLHAQGLPLPQYGRAFNPEGVDLIRTFAEQNGNG